LRRGDRDDPDQIAAMDERNEDCRTRRRTWYVIDRATLGRRVVDDDRPPAADGALTR
jgi:hypothetical protein